MECVLCNKQYTAKSETAFNLKLDNHQKNVNKQNSLQADQHFWLPGHNFNKKAKFTLLEQLNDTNIDKELLKYRLKKREDFWIIKRKLYNHMDMYIFLMTYSCWVNKENI